MKELTIRLTDDKQLKVEASEPLDPITLVDLSLSACLAMMSSIRDEAAKESENHAAEVQAYLFDMFNVAASALLAQFAPTKDLRPDLTEEAIFIKELELANDKLSNM